VLKQAGRGAVVFALGRSIRGPTKLPGRRRWRAEEGGGDDVKSTEEAAWSRRPRWSWMKSEAEGRS